MMRDHANELVAMAHAHGNLTIQERMHLESTRARAAAANRPPVVGRVQEQVLEVLRCTRDWHNSATLASLIGRTQQSVHKSLAALEERGIVERKVLTIKVKNRSKEVPRQVVHFRIKGAQPCKT